MTVVLLPPPASPAASASVPVFGAMMSVQSEDLIVVPSFFILLPQLSLFIANLCCRTHTSTSLPLGARSYTLCEVLALSIALGHFPLSSSAL